MKIGDKVKYTPRELTDIDKPNAGTITDYLPKGSIFNQDMLVIDTLEHWIPACDCAVQND